MSQRPTSNGAAPTSNPGTSSIGIPRPQGSEYICADCAALNEVRPREPIRCRECGHRVLYKQRTKRMLHFEAR